MPESRRPVPGYYHLARAWYADAVLRARTDIGDEVTFGQYFPEGGCEYEGAMRWVWLGQGRRGRLAAHLEIFDDGFQVFRDHPRLFRALAQAGEGLTAAGFCELLAAHGFSDLTPATPPASLTASAGDAAPGPLRPAGRGAGRAARPRARRRPAPVTRASGGGAGGRHGDGVSPAHRAVTGRPFEAVLYKPVAGESPAEAPLPYYPQFAIGDWWTPHPEVAASYSPRVRAATVRLQNPFVLRLGERPYFECLRGQFGTADPQEITAQLRERGHDGLIVSNVPANRFRLDYGQPVGMRDSAEVVVFTAGASG